MVQASANRYRESENRLAQCRFPSEARLWHSGSDMQIQLCKKSIDRLGSQRSTLLESLRDRDHSPVIKDCLTRCEACDQGLLIASADGLPLRAKDTDQLLDQIDSLSEAAD